MPTLLDTARRVVSRTNDWPGLRELYQAGYELGLSFAASRLKSVQGVLAIALRVGDEGARFVPGLSDYDLTVLCEPLDATRTIRFLEDFWPRYRQIKRAVPQLGETEIMTPEEYGDFIRFGPMPTGSLKHAEPLFVRPGRTDLEGCIAQRAHTPSQREYLLDALSRYVRFLFPAWLQHASDPTSTIASRTEHLLGNVRKRMQRLGASDETRPGERLDAMVARTFGELSRLCRDSDRLNARVAEVPPLTWEAPAGVIQAVTALCARAFDEAGVRDGSAVVWVSYLSNTKLNLVLVVPDEIPETSLANLVAALGKRRHELHALWHEHFTNAPLQAYFPCFAAPVVLSRSMWSCWRELSPFDGIAVAATGRALVGPADGIRDAPSLEALRRGAEVQYAALLPLKNNWRPLAGTGTAAVYASMIDHVRGYAAAARGDVVAQPEPVELLSMHDGYACVRDELADLRSHLLG